MPNSYDNYSFKVGKPFLNLCSVREKDGKVSYKRGQYYAGYHTVSIYQHGYNKGDVVILRLQVNIKGRIYVRTIEGKLYTDIGCGRKAWEFLSDLCRVGYMDQLGRKKSER